VVLIVDFFIRGTELSYSPFKPPKQMTKEFSFIVYPRTRPASVGPLC